MTLTRWPHLLSHKSRTRRRAAGPRRQALRPWCEPLEDRTLPALTAAFDFTMPPRLLDPDGDHRFLIPNTKNFANPANGFTVKLDAGPTVDDNPATAKYAWTIQTLKGEVLRNLTGEKPQTTLPEGTFQVKMTITADTASSTVARNIVVDDSLVVVAGDSFASGEGAPDVPQLILENPATDLNFAVLEEEKWARSTLSGSPTAEQAAMNKEHREAHRSSI